MYLTVQKKKEFFKDFGKSEFDTGTSEGQIAMFTFRISHLTEHLKININITVNHNSVNVNIYSFFDFHIILIFDSFFVQNSFGIS